jgi:5-formyltetrahydrofolate cyclo-ligase
MAVSKAELRARVREALRALPEAVRRDEAEDVVGRLAEVLPFGAVMAYVPLPDEVDVSPLLLRLAAEGRLALPRIHGEVLVPHRVVDPLGLAHGALGVREPDGDEAVVEVAAIAAVIVPARAYDRRGGRLGRGKGFYDRFLASVPQALRVGVAHSAHLVEDVPMELHDEPVDLVIAPGEVVVTGARGGTA